MTYNLYNRLADQPKAAERKDMAKFKIGDKVKVIESNRYWCEHDDLGAIGTIVKKLDADEEGSEHNNNFDYLVDFGEKKSFTLFGKKETCRFYDEDELELVEAPAQNWKLVIIPEGDTTKGIFYQNGKVEKTVEVKRYFKDEYSPKAAVYAIFDKLFGKSDEKKPEKKPEFPWDKFIQGRVIARFGSEKDFKNFLKECEKHGLKWNTGHKPTEWGDWCENRTLAHNAFPKNHPLIKLYDLSHLSQGKCTEKYEEIGRRKIPVIDWKVN